jgi:ubiquinone/menaquinone biosynthesis C-methylase UbiE
MPNKWKKKRDIMLRYDITADIYDRRYEEEQVAKYMAAIDGLKKRRFTSFLDVGCGTGLLFDHIAERTENIVGIDISRKTILKAKNRAAHHSTISLILADADSMPLKKRIFSCAFAVTIIQNMPNPVQTLNDIMRVSMDDAVIIVTGLKKIYSKTAFEALLLKARMHILALKDEEGLKCYVATCRKMNH